MHRVLVAVGGNFEKQINKLKKAGLEVQQSNVTYFGDEEEFIKKTLNYDCIIIGGGPWNEKVLSHLKGSLKMIAKFGVGVDNISINSATNYGIAVTNAPGSNARAVAEHALALMFAITRKIVISDKNMKSGFWENTKTDSIIGKNIGLLGFGNISRKLAEFLGGLPVNIMAYDVLKDETISNSLGVKYVDLDELIATSDIISIHVPLIDSTKGMVNETFFKNMKSSAYIINTARGAIINERDLILALKNGIIRGAALDTFEQEPLNKESGLLKLDNIILTPHSASNTEEAFASIMDCCVDNVIAFFAKDEFQNVLNPNYKNHL